MRWTPFLIYIAFAIFLASSAAVLISLDSGSTGLAIAGGMGNVIAGILFLLSAFLPKRKVDWERIEAEQRLWESGPLGRRWLHMRKRLYSRWKL